MGRAFSILLIIFSVWVGLTVYTEGLDRAYDGLFVKLGLAGKPPQSGVQEQPARGPVTQRVRERVDSAIRLREERLGRNIDSE